MHKESNGAKSVFKLSRRIPYIFSTYAVSCCLKSKAGYLASTGRTKSSGPIEKLDEDERKLWERERERKKEEATHHIFWRKHVHKNTVIDDKYYITWAILPRKEDGIGGFFAAVPLFKLRWSKNNRLDVVDSQ